MLGSLLSHLSLRKSSALAASCLSILLSTAVHARVLTLEEAIAAMLQENFQIRIQEQDTLISKDAIDSAKGEFDPYFFAETWWEVVNKDQNALDFVQTGAMLEQRYWEEDNIRFRTGIGGKTPFGTKVELSMNMMEGSNTITRNNPTSIFDPEYESFAGIAVTQPLLRDFGTAVNRAPIRVAELELGVTYYEREILITNQLVEVINAFHDIIYAQENLRVKQEAVELAETLLEENQKRVELGRMSQLDITQAKVQVSQAEEEVILAEDFLRDRKAALVRLIHSRRNPDILNFSVLGELESDPIPTPNAVQLERLAWLHRPDFLLARALVEQESVRRHYARNQMLPELNLQFNYGFTGLSNSVRNSFRRMEDMDTTQWSAGLVLRVPLSNTRARSEARAAERRRLQADIEVQRVEQQIYIDIHNAIERLETLQRRLRTAQQSIQLAEESLEVENRMLEEGRSTSFQVLQAQDALSNARTRHLAALVDLKKASAELDVVSGRLLNQYGLELTEIEDPFTRRKMRLLRWRWQEAEI